MVTGFKIYDNKNSDTPFASGVGTSIEIIFDGATKLIAAVAAIVLALTF